MMLICIRNVQSIYIIIRQHPRRSTTNGCCAVALRAAPFIAYSFIYGTLVCIILIYKRNVSSIYIITYLYTRHSTTNGCCAVTPRCAILPIFSDEMNTGMFKYIICTIYIYNNISTSTSPDDEWMLCSSPTRCTMG